jgi:hypothetical protein
MDSITEESPLATVLLVWDCAERLLDVPGLPYLCALCITHLALLGHRWDLLIPLGLWSYANRSQIAALVVGCCSLESTLALAACVSIAALIAHLMYKFLAHQASGEGLFLPAKPDLVPHRTRHSRSSFVSFFRHHLDVWYQAEPPKESLGRCANFTEKELEIVFRCYLEHLVEHAIEPLTIRYMPSGIPHSTEQTFTSSIARSGNETTPQLVSIRILTPVFYSRFVGYAHDFEAVFCELVESRTLWVDRPDVLPKIFLKKQSPPLHSSNILDFVAFKLIQNLRRRPDIIHRSKTSAEAASASTRPVDIRNFRISAMDAFILGHDDSRLRHMYQAALIQLFLAERFFSGYVEVARVLWLTCRLSLSSLIAAIAIKACSAMLSN